MRSAQCDCFQGNHAERGFQMGRLFVHPCIDRIAGGYLTQFRSVSSIRSQVHGAVSARLHKHDVQVHGVTLTSGDFHTLSPGCVCVLSSCTSHTSKVTVTFSEFAESGSPVQL